MATEAEIRQFAAQTVSIPTPDEFDSPENLARIHGQTTEQRYGLTADDLAKVRRIQDGLE